MSKVKIEMAGTVTTTRPAKAIHPPTSQMVIEAIENLNERRGSSVQAIKKYVSTNFTFDVVKSNFLIKKYLKTAVEKGELVQTSGKGATGSFKLGKQNTKGDGKKASKPKEKESKSSAKSSKSEKDKVKRTASMEKKSMKSPTSKPKAPKKASK